ncbi:MAG: hypothetical protein A2W91_17720 [Bacteroidetes bacterium GWF2_38_335]|nr:MAG: hypothetical protein A2W91_17720 [Bacteroidetes bacterium GWF2_38_335]OFY78027.1 MAG: hypothetical protein A2281_18740 [Bacteroidetes bacterium RIFOXYA12_FULL_38_20]HBS88299.1 hypothetical protein [Bacteroidales bacterium]
MTRFFWTLSALLFAFAVFSQSLGKKPLDHSVYDSWKNLKKSQISNNGNIVSWEIYPQKGDGYLYFYDILTKSTDSIARAKNAVISANSDFAVFSIVPFEDSVRKAKLDKVKKEKMPKDSMAIYYFADKKILKTERVKSFKLPKESGNWMVYHLEKELEKKDTTSKSDTLKTTEKPKEEKKEKKKKDNEGTKMVIYNPLTNEKFEKESINEYLISEEGNLICYISNKKDSIDTACVYVFNTLDKTEKNILTRNGKAKDLTIDKAGNQIAFLFSADTAKIKIYSLFYWSAKSGVLSVADTLTKNMPSDWCVNEKSAPFFSNDGNELYFKTSPKPEKEIKDTLLDDEKVKVDVWNWQDKKLQSQQVKEVEKEKSRGYQVVIHLKKLNMVQLADKIVSEISIEKKRENPLALGFAGDEYDMLSSWETPSYNDVYLVNIEDGSRKMILKKQGYPVHLSPEAKTMIYYNPADSSWYLYNIRDEKTISLTKNLKVNFYNEMYDMPGIPYPYEIVSWTEDEKFVLIYDRYDVWKFDVSGKTSPENITLGKGRESKTRFEYVWPDPEKRYAELDKVLLSGFNEETKEDGFYLLNYQDAGRIKLLVKGNFDFTGLKKAKKANKLIWQRESFIEYPDLWTSNFDFTDSVKLTNTNPQQQDYLWGSVELVKWKSFSGEMLQGLLYKPEDFHPANKYPMIVYFYERNSDELNNHNPPHPSRSIITPAYYTSNGYMVFVPDITYKTGFPGQSAYDDIVSGTVDMCKRKYIDPDKIGLQGQSWGGYQIAYLVTRTDMFACAMAGAAVTNMTSAYGGLRYESGVSRMFQYECTQSRIGATLWEKPQLYIENSPVFYADRINTPLLMMNNDNDGAVPWTQGIELFTAMRRLNKPVWLLNYNNEEHNLVNRAQCVDLSIRMQQFFDHYLKDKPAPVWMKSGVPAVKKGVETGYGL